MDFPKKYSDFLPTHASSSLAPYLDLTSATIDQVNRDLGFFGLEWQADHSQPVNILIGELADFMKQIQSNSGKLPQLMYRMDVSEMQLADILGNQKDEEAWNHVAALVWYRELKKVWLRKHFSTGSSDEN